MKNFNRKKSGDRDGGGFGNRGFDRRDSDRPEMFKATCSECGQRCEVPFKPSGDKPVFCSNCFGQRREEGGDRDRGGDRGRDRDRRDSGNRGFDRRDSGRLEMFSAVCDECGQRCEVPFKPSGDKPVFCSECFGKKKEGNGGGRDRDRRGSDRPDGGNNKMKEQLDMLNSKLDKIIKALYPNEQAPKENKVKKAAAVVEKNEIAIPEKKEVKPKKEEKKAPVKKTVESKSKAKKEVKKEVKKPVAKTPKSRLAASGRAKKK
jgi:CxxC-x17-CxxC domain-containing protein